MVSLCEDPLYYYSASNFLPHSHIINEKVGVFAFVIAVLYLGMTLLTIFWINLQERFVRNSATNDNTVNNESVKSVIFPIFTLILWLSAISSAYIGILMLFDPINTMTHNHNYTPWLYAVAYTLQHAVIEGIAFLFMQKGCGMHGAKQAGKMLSVWCAFTLMIQAIVFHNAHSVIAIFFQLIWSALLMTFYFCLWFAPQNRLFRRPAAILYGKFWFIFRVIAVIFLVLSEFSATANIGHCGYTFGPLLMFAIVQPAVCYVSLLQDSRWWQGMRIKQGVRSESSEAMQSPLVGLDLPLQYAQNLATVLDELGAVSNVKLLNFAHISLDKQSMLGQGSFSRVYRGAYRNKRCAVKLIYTMDLTQEIVQRVAAEATILSSVKIFGVAVLPPSVCILLEICMYGSLSDVLRGDAGSGRTRRPLTLADADRMYLAMGCARGVAALHALNKHVVHRDIKSMNFLVDSQLNAKLADLELGGAGAYGQQTSESLPADDILVNWMAPEVLQGEQYTQSSDVYSLSLVLWEIVSGEIPYVDVKAPNGKAKAKNLIRMKVLAGHRPTIPLTCPVFYGRLLEAGWATNASTRISAQDMVQGLHGVWRSICTPELQDLENMTDVSRLIDQYFITSPHALNELVEKTTSYSTSSSHNKWAPSLGSSSSGTGAISMAKSPRKSPLAPPPDRRPTSPLSAAIEATRSPAEAPAPELISLHRALQCDLSWQLVEVLTQPILILTSRSPHICLKASNAFCDAYGYTQSHLAGKYFDDIIGSSVDIPSVHGFYESMLASGAAHAVLPVLTLSHEEIVTSVHVYPIHRRSASVDNEMTAATAALMNENVGGFDLESKRDTSDHAHRSLRLSDTTDIVFYVVYCNLLREADPPRCKASGDETGRSSSISGRFHRLLSIDSLNSDRLSWIGPRKSEVLLKQGLVTEC